MLRKLFSAIAFFFEKFINMISMKYNLFLTHTRIIWRKFSVFLFNRFTYPQLIIYTVQSCNDLLGLGTGLFRIRMFQKQENKMWMAVDICVTIICK